jgi:hypothetical protein
MEGGYHVFLTSAAPNGIIKSHINPRIMVTEISQNPLSKVRRLIILPTYITAKYKCISINFNRF